MLEKLVIKFIKLERALGAQQLEIKASNNLDNKYEDNNHVIFHQNGIDFADEAVWISKSNSPRVAVRMFDSNDERDKYLDKVVKWISEEQFATSGKLEVGKLCEVSNDGSCWARRILLAILPEGFNERYICQSNIVDIGWIGCEYARPITSIQPTIDEDDNEIYTWEMEAE